MVVTIIVWLSLLLYGSHYYCMVVTIIIWQQENHGGDDFDFEMCLSLDSAYTERFMGLPTPDDNWQGYQQAALTR